MYKELISEFTQNNNKYVKIQSPCTGEELEKAEKAVGYPFPKELDKLLFLLQTAAGIRAGSDGVA